MAPNLGQGSSGQGHTQPHCRDRAVQGRGTQTMLNVAPVMGQQQDKAPWKVAPSQGSSRSHLHLWSSRWSSRPFPGPMAPRCPLGHTVTPHHHWGHFPGKGEQIRPRILFPHQPLGPAAFPSLTQPGCPAPCPPQSQ